MTYFEFSAYLRFLLKSTNAHGVHSPFVFNYVTQCLSSKKKHSKDKSINVLLNSIAYFSAKSIWIAEGSKAQKIVKKYDSNLIWNTPPFDILFFEELDKKGFMTLLSEGKIHNDTIIFINSIYTNPQKHELWKELINIPGITVSMDMFHLGALSIRKEQLKQHFTIRI
ncbi:hypothetical protein [Flagellimonas nanhaiensis]|uniref:Class I SAM-dependent methyltransferase n=1 Tax=Flagellimonas nanhaiensis TaxID=2292706 RepID=A0A371JT70_9FLAO|nr:hypothetical protein [Allomuricauda nanhaiensis]RDY61012.1 hypothetical protein DX873_02200 [Allomuricauda nanhaiensis]